jgi:eukaryotic-like serine/threonine-protein kinase
LSSSNDDILFVEHALKRGLVSEEQVDEVLLIQEKVMEMGVPDAIPSLMVKRGLLQQKDADDILSVIRPKSRKEQIPGYHIIRRLGHGGMGSVYLARQTAMDRLVALKVLKPSLTKDPQQIERLRREAQYVGKLNHPNIIRGLDVGESGGFHFLAMEYVEGVTLKDRLKPGQFMRESEALRVLRDVAEALDHAWRSRITHRDIKPGNIMLRTDGTALLMDYGLAKGPLDVSLTQTGSTLGTPQYLSPEQARNPREVDVRTDLYALGATLYHMLTGRPPFTGENLAEIVTQVLLKAPDPPQAINEKISANAAFLIDRLMTKDTQHRYASPRELLRDLEAIEKGRSIVPNGWEGDWKAFVLRRRYRRLLTFSIAVFVLFVVMAVTMVVKWRQAEEAQHLEYASNARIDAELQEGKRGNVTFENLETWRDSLAELHERYGDVEPWFGERLFVWSPAVEAKERVVSALSVNAALPSDHFAARIANLKACEVVVEGRPVVEARVAALIKQLRIDAADTADGRLDKVRQDARLSLEEFQHGLQRLLAQFASRWKDTLPALTAKALASDLRMTTVLLKRLKSAEAACREKVLVLTAPESDFRFQKAWTEVKQATEKVRFEEGVKEELRGLPEHIRDRFKGRLGEVPDLIEDADQEACAALRTQVAEELKGSGTNNPGVFGSNIALLKSRAQSSLESSRGQLTELATDLKKIADGRRELAEKRYREIVAPDFRRMLRLRQPDNAADLLERYRQETTTGRPDGHQLAPWVAETLRRAEQDLGAVREVWDRFRRWLDGQRGKTLDSVKDGEGISSKREVIEVVGWTFRFTNAKGKEEELSIRDLDLDSALANAGLSGSGRSDSDSLLAGIVRWIEEPEEKEENLLSQVDRLLKIEALLLGDRGARHLLEVKALRVQLELEQETRESTARTLFEESRDELEKEGKVAAARTGFERLKALPRFKFTKFFKNHQEEIESYIKECETRRESDDLSTLFNGGRVHLFDDVDRIMRNLARASVSWPLEGDDGHDERKDFGIDIERARIVAVPGIDPADLPGPPAPGVAVPEAASERKVLAWLQGDVEEDLLERHPIMIDNPFLTGERMIIEFDVRSPRPLFLAVSLAGCTCGILSQVDRVEGGQGVSFWLHKEISNLDQRRTELRALRRPNVLAAENNAATPMDWLRRLETDYFHMLPDRWYRLRFTKGRRIATLRVDGRVVGEWTFKTGSPPDPRRIVILTYTTTLLDNLRIEGTVDRAWLQRRGR